MQQESDLVYLGRRALEERRAAGGSDNRNVRDVHLELASAYEFRMHLLRKQAARQAALLEAAEKPFVARSRRRTEPIIEQRIPPMLV